MGLAGADIPSMGDVLEVAASLRWSRPDLTADLAEHLVDAATAAGDRATWVGATAWTLHGRSASGDGRVKAWEVIESLPDWGGTAALTEPMGARLRVELGVAAHLAQAVDVARAILTAVLDQNPDDPAIRADALCGLARCALDDAPAEVPHLLDDAAAAWSRLTYPLSELGGASVELMRAVAHRRAGRGTEAARRAVAGLERLSAVRGPSHVSARTGHLAAALATEWVTGLVDSGAVTEAREACETISRRLPASGRRGRAFLRLRLAVLRVTAGAGARADVLDELRRVAAAAASADIPDLESVCRSTLGELLDKNGSPDQARSELRLAADAEHRDRARSRQLRDRITAAEALLTSGHARVARVGATGPTRVNGSAGRHSVDDPLGSARPDPAGWHDGWSWGGSSHGTDTTTAIPNPSSGRAPRHAAGEPAPPRNGHAAPGGAWGAAATRSGRGGEASSPVPSWTDGWGTADRGAGARSPGRHAASETFGPTGEPNSRSTTGRAPDRRPALGAEERGRRELVEEPDTSSDSPIGDLLFRELSRDLGRRHDAEPVGPRYDDRAPARHEPIDPWATGTWPTSEPDRGGGGSPVRPDPLDRSPRHGTSDTARPSEDPDGWLASALADLDRIWPRTGGPATGTGRTERGRTAGGEPGSAHSGRHARHDQGPQHTPPESGPTAVIDLVVAGERMSGRRATHLVRVLTDRIAAELPSGAQLRTDQPGTMSVVFPGRSPSAVAEWLHRVMPGLAAAASGADAPPGAQLRAAVHDRDGSPGVQIVQRLDTRETRADPPSPPARGAGTPPRFPSDTGPSRSGRHRHRAEDDSPVDDGPAPAHRARPPERGRSAPPPPPENLGLGDLLAGALAAYRGL